MLITQTVHVCREYEQIAVPLREIMDVEGRLDIYPEVNAKGYFDIDYAEGRLVLKSRGFVGLIPISDRVAIHVQPRAPIANLLYMVWRAGRSLSGLENFIRGYQDQPSTLDNPEAVYFETFLKTLRNTRRTGLLRKYRETQTDQELRGRLLLTKTVDRFRSRGICHRQVFSVHDHSVNILENRILKYTVERLLNHFQRLTHLAARETQVELRRLLDQFGAVESTGMRPEIVARSALSLIRGLPNSHRFYEPALWLSYLIATKSGVIMEKDGRARFETILIDVATVFEAYVRNLCEEAAIEHLGGCKVLDGNKATVPLFIENSRYPTKPDIYFKRGALVPALADVKYKPKLSSEDRYELLGFCEALQVNIAAFICPKHEATGHVSLHGTTATGKRIYVLTIALDAADLPAEEKRFTKQLGETLELVQN